MRRNLLSVLNDYLEEQKDVFSMDEVSYYLKSCGFRLSNLEIEALLRESEYVYNLDSTHFITYSGVYDDCLFSFQLSHEEIEKGHFIIGARGVPYLDPNVSPDSIVICSDSKEIKPEVTEFSMNFLLDRYALFGEGFDIMTILSDSANSSLNKISDMYKLPTKVLQTSWAIKDIAGGDNVSYGDRVICRVLNWRRCIVDVAIQKTESNDLIISNSHIQREQWYSDFEEGMLEEFEQYGPCNTIFGQLAHTIINNRTKLIYNKNCGAVEDFLSHTSKLAFKNYGVENRIWKKNEEIPFVGKWASDESVGDFKKRLAYISSENVLNALLKNDVYEIKSKKNTKAGAEIWKKVLPKFYQLLQIPTNTQEEIFLNIENRRAIIEKEYNPFQDYALGDIRKRTIALYSRVLILIIDLVYTADNMKDYQPRDLIMLNQLCQNIERVLDEFETVDCTSLDVEYITPTLDGMEDTFEVIEDNLRTKLDKHNKNSFKIYSGV